MEYKYISVRILLSKRDRKKQLCISRVKFLLLAWLIKLSKTDMNLLAHSDYSLNRNVH